MKSVPAQTRTITAAQRGQIVQRVIVDGWTTAQAAAAFAIEERLIAAWVAAFRRDGMASLYHNPSKTVAGELVERWLARPCCNFCRRTASVLRRLLRHDRPVEPSPLRRPNEERRGL